MVRSIKEKVDIVLMTNSPEPDSMVIIEKLGAKTIFIDFHNIANEDSADIVVKNLEDSFDALKTLG